MELQITNQTCNDIVFNGHYLEKLYYNEHLVWEKQHAPVNPYASQYFTIESLEDNNSVTLAHTENAPTINAYYSLDNGTTWTQHSTSAEKTWVLNTGDKLLIKATADAWATDIFNYNYFRSTKQFDVYGNSMSLLYGDNFVNQYVLNNAGHNLERLFYNATYLTNAENLILPATTLAYSCYSNMFEGCTSLTTAPELPATTLATSCYISMFNGCSSLTTAPTLPATTLAASCYNGMFIRCSSLVNAPVLPATTLANACYGSMFSECTSLTTAPELPATTLAHSCYSQMFVQCTSLTKAPKLLATTLVIQCYYQMFWYCTSLNEVVCLATDISASNCLYMWLDNVASTGTFIKDSSMSSWPSGSSGIPSGWTIQNYN